MTEPARLDAERIVRMAEESGELAADVDGFVYYWPKGSGSLASWHLRVIADELDRRNAAWAAQIERDLGPRRNDGG